MTARRDSWAPADLARRLCDALAVARNAVDHLGDTGYVDEQEPANNVRGEKVISESGLLLFAAATASQREHVNNAFREFAGCLLPHARSERMLVAICTQPALAWDYGFAHACLARVGYPDARFDEALRAAASSQARHGRERPPHRMLEQMWASRAIAESGGAQGHRTPRGRLDVLRATVVNRPMDLLGGSRDDAYAFTHALMYATDFNVDPWPLPRRRDAILADAEAVLARALDEQDYDLAGEILLAWPLTGTTWSPAASFGFSVLAQIEDRAGFLPSMGTRPERLATLHGEARKQYVLATAYHTAYVMGLLCAASLQEHRAPPTRVAPSRREHGASRLLLQRLDADPQRPHWREAIDTLDAVSRDSLASLLFTIGLRRSVTARDFGRLLEFLRLGQRLGLTDMPAASQAAEMLARLSHVADHSANGLDQTNSSAVGFFRSHASGLDQRQ